MPIANVNDAVEVRAKLADFLNAGDTDGRVNAARALFVETLDWQYADGLIPLHSAQNDTLPLDAQLIANRCGTSAVYVPPSSADTKRITASIVNAAARSLDDALDGDLLLLFTNGVGNEFHIVRPDLTQTRPRLQRMVVRSGEHHRTVVQQLANMWNDYGRNGKTVYEAIIAAFSVEPVTKRFFAEYRRVFDDAKNAITGFEDERDLHLFTQTLFNRLMFVYFVSRKGWLKFDDDTDYLNALWRDYNDLKTGDSNFYWDRLRLLFFAGLNNPKSEDLTRYPDALRLIGSVPFLNGGLFEETNVDVCSDIYVPDVVILSVLRDLFDHFNFTVMESTPYDTEVAVDPEMLGKVFEELVNERHEAGAYYTPRPVVSFMCREALKGFLASATTGLSDNAINGFVDAQNTQDISVANARKVAAALERVTVVDPACGSGAYLLGMMQELVDLQTTLFNVGVDAKTIYDLKLEIIQRNLYGADIDDFAVNIAMLRLWLSLVIEYEGDMPEPLPNLDFKIACGDSLLAPNPDPKNYGDLFGDFIRQFDLGSLKAEHMRTTEQAEKDRLKAEIEDARKQIIEMLGDAVRDGKIDWRVEFAEVMGDGGFDVVIANPPYGITVKDRRSAVIGHTDSYTNFMGLARDLAPNGIMDYITPTSWETGERFRKFRQYLFGEMALQIVVNLPYDVFETPYVDTAITVGAMGKPAPSKFRLATLDKRAELDLTQITDYVNTVDWSAVSGDNALRVPLLDWSADLFARIGAKATPLGEIASLRRGIEAYQYDILRHQGKDGMPFFGGQVRRYAIEQSSEDNYVVVKERESSYHEGLRIWTRRIVSRANRLMSALTHDDFVVKKDIYITKPNFADSHKTVALLAILNSSLVSFLYLSRSAAAVKDDFRQVTLSGLRELPIIFPDSSGMSELTELVAAREYHVGDIEELERQIDSAIYRTYGVTEDEQMAIEEWLARSG